MEVSRSSGYVVNRTVDQKVCSLNPTVALMSFGKTPSTFATLDPGDVSGYLAGMNSLKCQSTIIRAAMPSRVIFVP